MHRYITILIVCTLLALHIVAFSQEGESEDKAAYKYCIDLVKEGSLIGMATDVVSDPNAFIETFDERYDELGDAAFICWDLVEPYTTDAGEKALDFGSVVVDRAGEAWIASQPQIIRKGSETGQFLEKKLEQSGAILQAGWEVTREDVYPVLRDDVLPVVIEQGKRLGKWIGKQLDR